MGVHVFEMKFRAANSLGDAKGLSKYVEIIVKVLLTSQNNIVSTLI